MFQVTDTSRQSNAFSHMILRTTLEERDTASLTAPIDETLAAEITRTVEDMARERVSMPLVNESRFDAGVGTPRIVLNVLDYLLVEVDDAHRTESPTRFSVR